MHGLEVATFKFYDTGWLGFLVQAHAKLYNF